MTKHHLRHTMRYGLTLLTIAAPARAGIGYRHAVER